jgi:Putative Ig domain
MPAGLARCYAGHRHQRAVPGGWPAPRGPAEAPFPASAGRQQTPAPLAGQVTITSPGGTESRRGVPARRPIEGSAGPAYRATSVPPGLVISPAGLITGTARTPGPRTVTVTATPASGGTAVTTFVWTISPPSS